MTIEETLSTRRQRPKGDKRARTRAALIDAACDLIREKGYENTTIVEVAARAGMTTGAIYNNFKNRDELFMAVAEVKGAPILPNIRPGMSFRELMRAMAEAVIEALPQRRSAIVGTLGFLSFAITHEEFRERVVAESAESYRRVAAGTLALLPQSELPMPVDALVRVVHALTDGLVLRRLVTPELISDDVIYAAFDALAHHPDNSCPPR